ncbi:1-4-dihydroxy-2-naphthoyl-CoA synthase [Nymphaea thermarum]|nr:1-4-dihydroxy-2-naphthoyl-CoA synthase [Nymphaea thermarum]
MGLLQALIRKWAPVAVVLGVGTQAFCSGGDQASRLSDGYADKDSFGRLNVLDLQRLAGGKLIEADGTLVDLGNLGALSQLVAGVGGFLVGGLVTAEHLIGGEGLVADRAAVSEGGWRLHGYRYWRRSGAAIVGNRDGAKKFFRGGPNDIGLES